MYQPRREIKHFKGILEGGGEDNCNALVPYEEVKQSPISSEIKLLRARIYSKHEHRNSTLLFTLKVLLIPGKEVYDIVDHLTSYGYKTYENDRLINLNSKNDILNISLTNICYPDKICTLSCNPVTKKCFNDALIWEDELIETEFCFVFQGVNKTDLSNFFFKGTVIISHGSSDVMTAEILFFIEKEIEGSSYPFPYGIPKVTQNDDLHSHEDGNLTLSLISDNR